MPTDWWTIPQSLCSTLSCSFSIFYSFFLSISPVPLTIPVPYKGTQFRRRGIVSASFEATLCPVYRAYSYAVHRCIRRYSVAIPPSYRSSPLSPSPLSPALLYFRHSHRSALNSLYNARLSRARCRRTNSTVAAAQRGLCECNACRAPRYVPACALRVLSAWERNRRPLIRWRIRRDSHCLVRGG